MKQQIGLHGPASVSVAMITYNHAPYIRQAVESVLSQKTDFPLELIIGEDCSSDGTREIVEALANQHPGFIRLVLSDHNVGSRLNMKRTFAACRYRYVAMLEGDDYWTDPEKLQKQVDFLRKHPQCSVCGHAVRNYDENLGRFSGTKPLGSHPPVFDLRFFLRTNAMQTLSMVFVREVLDTLPPIYDNVPFGDYLLKITCGLHGSIGFLNEKMGVYRMHGSGMVFSDKAEFLRKSIRNLDMIAPLLPTYQNEMNQERHKLQCELVAILRLAGEHREVETLLASLSEGRGYFSRMVLAVSLFLEEMRLRMKRSFPVVYVRLKERVSKHMGRHER